MQIEKKLILCSILAVAIGIAAIAPAAYFMNTAVSAQSTEDKPWFNLNINYATAGITNPFGEDIATYQVSYNYTVNPDAVDTKVGGRIEYYRLQVYSDKTQLVNTTAYLAVNCSEYLDRDAIAFERKGWFNTSGLASVGSFSLNFTGTLDFAGAGASFGTTAKDNPLNEKSGAQQLQDVQDAQTIYVDVYRIAYITCSNNSTTVHLANDEVIQHVELTKNGDQFVYGTKPSGWMLDKIPGEV